MPPIVIHAVDVDNRFFRVDGRHDIKTILVQITKHDKEPL
jgi:hypothetical protein